MTRQEDKQHLRRTIRAMERSLPDSYRTQSAGAICAHLAAMPEYLAADTVFCFVGTAREIDTTAFLTAALRDGKRLCVPRCAGEGRMTLHQITALSRLSPGTYGIPEPPPDAPKVSVDAVDFAVIPCLTCGRGGRRLGQGGGYYDRFLAQYRAAAVLVCRERLLREEIPMEPHDCFVPWVVTERGLYEDGLPAKIE
jgi:5-formyltetrahydrofolate cyclo-ligase